MGERLNIVYVGTFGLAPKSTMGARALPLARELAAQGHAVTLLLPPWDNPADSGRSWSDQSVRVVNVSIPPALPLLGYLRLALRLLRAALALRPGVVHVFKPKGFGGFVAQALLAMQALGAYRGIRAVVDTDDWEGDGGWNDVEPYAWWQKRLFAWQERWLLRHAPAVTCASAELVRMTSAIRGSGASVYYVPNGAAEWPEVAPDRITVLRRQLGLPADRPVLLLYTRFVECSPQRLVRLLKAIDELGAEATALLVGAGLHREEQEFRLEAEGSGLGLPLVATGWVPASDLPAYLALADTALFPMEDTLINRTKCSVKLIDLLSAGVPVVAEAVGQCAEYIEDGVSGVLTPPGDDAALAAAVAALAADRPRRQALGAAARERMRLRFGWRRVAGPLAKAYGLE